MLSLYILNFSCFIQNILYSIVQLLSSAFSVCHSTNGVCVWYARL